MKTRICLALLVLGSVSALSQEHSPFRPIWDTGVSTNSKPNAISGFALLAISSDLRTGLALADDGIFHTCDLQNHRVSPTKLIAGESLRIQLRGAPIAEEDRRWVRGYFFKGNIPYAIVSGWNGGSYSTRVKAEVWNLTDTNLVLKMGKTFRESTDSFTNIFPDRVNNCQLLPDRQTLIVCSGSDANWNEEMNNLSAWDLNTGNIIRLFSGAKGAIYDFAVSKHGKQILAGGFDIDVHIWDAQNGKLLTNLSRGKTIPPGMETTWTIFKVALSANDKYAAAASGSGCVFVWDIAAQKMLGEPLRFPNAPFYNMPAFIAFDPKGTELAVAKGSEIRLYRLPKLELVKVLHGKQLYPTKLSFLDHDTIAISSVEGPEGACTRFWKLQN